MKFEIGDIIKSNYTGCHWRVEPDNRIECVKTSPGYSHWTLGSRTHMCSEPDYFTLISKAKKFKVGDKVKILSKSRALHGCPEDSNWLDDKFPSRTGTIAEIKERDGDHSYKIRDELNENHWHFAEKDLDFAGFKVGDKVRCITSPTGDRKYVGQIVTVSEVENGHIKSIKEWSKESWMYLDSWFELVHSLSGLLADQPLTYPILVKEPCTITWGSATDNTFFSSFDFIQPIIKPKKSIMKTLNNFITKLVDADTQALLKAGYLNGDLLPTCEGIKALEEILFFANKQALVDSAKAKIAAEEAKK